MSSLSLMFLHLTLFYTSNCDHLPRKRDVTLTFQEFINSANNIVSQAECTLFEFYLNPLIDYCFTLRYHNIALYTI